jgi:hypothetical protein
MTNPRYFKDFSAGISLAILATGFILLGILTLANRRPENLPGPTAFEKDFCLTGSIISILAGGLFLLAGCLYWTRSAAIRGRHHEGQVNSEEVSVPVSGEN